MTMITGGELAVRTLMAAGVSKIFGLHGAHIDTIFQSCLDHGIKIVDVRHEAAAGHAAEGYARASNQLGVALITAGVGFANVVTSIANAFLDRTPVLYITGAPSLKDAETNTLQAGIDQVAMAKPITKWAHQVTSTEQIPRLLAQAIRIARSSPTGPVLLELPWDVLMGTVEEGSVPVPRTIWFKAPSCPQEDAVERSLDLLSQAARPVLLVGAEAWRSDAADELQKFVETTGIPVFSDFDGHGLLPSDHLLYGGTLHKMADLASDNRPDVVLALGIRFGLFTFGGSPVLIPSEAQIIHVHTDAKEIGRLRDVAVPIVADSRETLRALNAQAGTRKSPDRSAWQQVIQQAKAERHCKLMKLVGHGTRIHPFQALETVFENIEPDTLVVGDGAETYTWVNEVIHQKRGGSYITHGYFGSMGIGLGLAVGAKSADLSRPVLCVIGDGAVGFTIAEFDTMVRHNLTIVVVVMNNQSWAACQHFQELFMGPSRVTATRLGNAEYHKVAAGFGCYSEYVARIEELGPAVKRAFASGRAACVEVAVDVAPMSPETLMLVGKDPFPAEAEPAAPRGA